MSTPDLPSIAYASVELELLFADGTRLKRSFALDDKDGPIQFRLDSATDLVDVTELSVDDSRRYEPGRRGSASLSISGRGPAT